MAYLSAERGRRLWRAQPNLFRITCGRVSAVFRARHLGGVRVGYPVGAERQGKGSEIRREGTERALVRHQKQ